MNDLKKSTLAGFALAGALVTATPSIGAVTFLLQDSGPDIQVTVSGSIDLSEFIYQTSGALIDGRWYISESNQSFIGWTSALDSDIYFLNAGGSVLPQIGFFSILAGPGSPSATGSPFLAEAHQGGLVALSVPAGSPAGNYIADSTYTFNGHSIDDLGLTGVVDHLLIDGPGDNDVYVTTQEAVPEPSRVFLSLAAIGALALRRRRRT